MPADYFTTFTNCRQCINGELVEERMVISEATGKVLKSTGYIGGEIVDLDDGIIAPGFLELQTNGVNGFHFTHFENEDQYARKLEETAKHYVTTGVTGFWATIPTVSPDDFKKILPSLHPRPFTNGATLLGAHAEGPYLHPSRKGAHNFSLFHEPSIPPSEIYGPTNFSAIKLVTLAPELPNSAALIAELTSRGIRVSMGHSSATYEQGLAGLAAGATALTHTCNAMAPLHHRAPGLAGLITMPPHTNGEGNKLDPPFYSLIPDGHHLHPSIVTLLHRAAPHRSILISDSVELAGLPDGVYPGHTQIPHAQRKRGNLVTIDGTETMIGGCMSVADGVQNLMSWSGCNVAEAVRCVTENVAEMMGVREVGRLEEGRRADFVVLSEEGEVLQTWVAGRKVWEK